MINRELYQNQAKKEGEENFGKEEKQNQGLHESKTSDVLNQSQQQSAIILHKDGTFPHAISTN